MTLPDSPPFRFIGYEQPLTYRFLGIAVALLISYTAMVAFSWAVRPLPNWLYWVTVVLGSIGCAVANAYYNSGLLMSWILTSTGLAPIIFLFAITSPIEREPTIFSGLNVLASFTVIYVIPVGTTAFVLGFGARKIHDVVTHNTVLASLHVNARKVKRTM